MSNDFWTPEMESTLRKMWGDGRSAREIALALGGLTRNSVVGKLHRLGLGRADRDAVAAPRKVCAVPGCGVALSRVNKTGVCMAHVHAAGHCGCVHCAAAAAVAKPAPVARPDVRVVMVAAGDMRISLPREPWLAGGVA